jgi:EAL domain-containing protein (putative c-di-GMP-specific phosphodiesterase class I)
LRDSLKKNESIGRISGDDFVILLASASEEQVIRRTLELLKLTAQPLSLPEQTLSITASSGIALWPADGDSLGSLLQKAEIGKYKAKASGRNNYQFYESQMQEMASLRLAQNNALKTALDNQELHLCFQPQVCLQDQTVAGVEALLRWNSRDWGVVPPSDFIPLAESSGLILTIGDWVLDTAMAQLRNWLDQGIPPVTMAVNISAIQFEHPDFIEQVSCALARYRIPPQLLELELTEAMAMKKPKISEQRMRELHMMGVKLSIDDFGTGYSSLSYLKRFKIDKLKIDREFIADMDHDPDDQAIVTAIIQMARRLSISVLAEGVETARQAELLRRLGCHQIQGYHYSKPLPASDAASYIRQHSSPA